MDGGARVQTVPGRISYWFSFLQRIADGKKVGKTGEIVIACALFGGVPDAGREKAARMRRLRARDRVFHDEAAFRREA